MCGDAPICGDPGRSQGLINLEVGSKGQADSAWPLVCLDHCCRTTPNTGQSLGRVADEGMRFGKTANGMLQGEQLDLGEQWRAPRRHGRRKFRNPVCP